MQNDNTTMKIPKNSLDYLVSLLKAHYKNPRDVSIINAAHIVSACDLEFTTKGEVDYIAFENFLCGILSPNGINPNATNDEIYESFKALGVEVVDE